MSLRATLWTLCVLAFTVMTMIVQTFPAEALNLPEEDRAAVSDTAEASSSAFVELRSDVATMPYFSAHWGRPEDANAFAQDLGCYEDEMIVLVIAEVQPDNGVPPNVDWAPKGDLTGRMLCVAVDDVDLERSWRFMNRE